MKKIIGSVFILVLMASCNVKSEEINYNSEACHFCSMTISDSQYAAEIVTKKGKVFKFDASECMLYYLKENEKLPVELYLVNDYETPKDLTDATKAVFLISKNLPSPMGANLTAFKKESTAKEVQIEKGGELFTWEEIRDKFKD